MKKGGRLEERDEGRKGTTHDSYIFSPSAISLDQILNSLKTLNVQLGQTGLDNTISHVHL